MNRYISKQLCYEPSYRGLHIRSEDSPLITSYLDSELRVIEYVLSKWSLVYAFRFDLHFPKNSYDWPANTISRFTASLESKIYAQARRVGYCKGDVKPRFVWAKEQAASDNCHYHLAVFLDGKFISSAGVIKTGEWSLKKAIIEAWALATALPIEVVQGLPHFAENGEYLVNIDSADFLQELTDLFYRISYFAKLDTKHYGDGSRQFTASRVPAGFHGINLDDLITIHKRDVWELDSSEYLRSSWVR